MTNTNESQPLLLIVEDNPDLRLYIHGHQQDQYSDNGLHAWKQPLTACPT